MFKVDLNIEKSILINKSPLEIYSVLSNFENWPHWSPWLTQEPNCAFEVNGSSGTIGHKQSWSGELIGSGEMILISTEESRRLDYDLFFKKPFKSQSKVSFLLKEESEGTLVTWSMNGSLPIFLFFLKKLMTAWIGQDYSRGLSMLKEFCENGKVASTSTIQGEKNEDEIFYVGIRHQSSLADMPALMGSDFQELEKAHSSSKIKDPDIVLSMYHTFDFVNGVTDFTSAYGYRSSSLNQIPEGFVSGKLPSNKSLAVEHKGPYHHLGNAWATGFSLLRAKKYRQHKKTPIYEIYVSDPRSVSAEELITETRIPIR